MGTTGRVVPILGDGARRLSGWEPMTKEPKQPPNLKAQVEAGCLCCLHRQATYVSRLPGGASKISNEQESVEGLGPPLEAEARSVWAL